MPRGPGRLVGEARDEREPAVSRTGTRRPKRNCRCVPRDFNPVDSPSRKHVHVATSINVVPDACADRR